MKRPYRLTLERFLPRGPTVFGDLVVNDHEPGGEIEEVFRCLSAERAWNGNKRGESCVPTGFYVLEPHNGTKYRDTWALIGETVSHLPTPGIARSACVLHWASSGAGLAGCVSGGHELEVTGKAAALEGRAIGQLIELLNQRDGPHYLTIR